MARSSASRPRAFFSAPRFRSAARAPPQFFVRRRVSIRSISHPAPHFKQITDFSFEKNAEHKLPLKVSRAIRPKRHFLRKRDTVWTPPIPPPRTRAAPTRGFGFRTPRAALAPAHLPRKRDDAAKDFSSPLPVHAAGDGVLPDKSAVKNDTSFTALLPCILLSLIRSGSDTFPPF